MVMHDLTVKIIVDYIILYYIILYYIILYYIILYYIILYYIIQLSLEVEVTSGGYLPSREVLVFARSVNRYGEFQL